MKRWFIFAMLLAVALVGSGCGIDQGFYPLLSVEGDVDNVISFSPVENDFTEQSYTCNEEKYTGYSLNEILEQAGVKSDNSKIYLVSADGMMAALDYAQLEENYIAFTGNGWEAMNVNYPPSGDVKEIKKIVVVDLNEKPDYGLTITKADGTTANLTAGKLLVSDNIKAFKEEGTNRKNDKEVTVYTTISGLYIPDYLGCQKQSLINLGDADAKSAFYYADGYITVSGNTLKYVSFSDNETVESICSLSLK